MFRWPVPVPAFARFGGSGGRSAPPLQDRTVRVGSRTAAYGVADGGGQPLLFLHGWGLTHRSYAAPVRALADAGFRVIAPDLPGFGGTGDLPAGGISFAGYAAFVDALLAEIEPEARLHVVGHSFGGGVTVQFCHDFPARVRSVVLVDAVSGATWTRSGADCRTLASRPLWDWAYHLMMELPVAGAPGAVAGLVGEVARNLVRHPASLGLVAHLIRRSDLRAELAALHERGTPVTVIWGEDDRVVPRAAYEDLCEALGAAGETVAGTHSWPLGAPGRFAEAVRAAIALAEEVPSGEGVPPVVIEAVAEPVPARRGAARRAGPRPARPVPSSHAAGA